MQSASSVGELLELAAGEEHEVVPESGQYERAAAGQGCEGWIGLGRDADVVIDTAACESRCCEERERRDRREERMAARANGHGFPQTNQKIADG